jgi:hypothetical protein
MSGASRPALQSRSWPGTSPGAPCSRAWRPTAEAYLGRVTKSRIVAAVRKARGARAAERIAGLKKAEMATAAEELLAGTGWVPEGRVAGADPEALARLINGATLHATLWIAASEAPEATLVAASGAMDRLLDGLAQPAPPVRGSVARPRTPR